MDIEKYRSLVSSSLVAMIHGHGVDVIIVNIFLLIRVLSKC
jgi:hypothetical protein